MIYTKIFRVILKITPLILMAYECVRMVVSGDSMPASCSLGTVLILLAVSFRLKMCWWYQSIIGLLGLISVGFVDGPVVSIVGLALLIKVIMIWRKNSGKN